MRGTQHLQDEAYPEAQASAFIFGVGKRRGRGSLVAPGVAPTISTLSSASHPEGALSVFCRRRRRAFLVDSGADISVYPATAAQKKCQPSSTLVAANGSSIRTFGKRNIFLSFPGLKVVHSFLLAEVRKPILGSDFFRANDLLIDISGRRLFRAAELSLIHI